MKRNHGILLAAGAITLMTVALAFSKTYLLFFLFLPPAIILILLPAIVQSSMGKLETFSGTGNILLAGFYATWVLFGALAFMWGWSGPQTPSYPVLEQFNSIPASGSLQEGYRVFMGFTFWVNLGLAIGILSLILFNPRILGQLRKETPHQKIKGIIILACLALVTIVLPWVHTLVTNPMIVENSNTGGIGLGALLLVPYLLTGLAVGFFSLIFIPIRLKRLRLKGVVATIGITTCLVSLAQLGYGAFYAYTSYIEGQERVRTISKSLAISLINDCQIGEVIANDGYVWIDAREGATAEIFKKWRHRDGEYGSFNDLRMEARKVYTKCGRVSFLNGSAYSPKSIGLDEATNLLQQCNIIQFSYPPEHDQRIFVMDPEQSPTGVIVSHSTPPTYMFIAERMAPQLLPVVEQAKNACPDLSLHIGDRWE